MNPSSKPTTEPACGEGVIRVRIRRFDPEVDAAPRYEAFEVPYRPLMRVLDVLDHVHEALAVDIGYRWLCTSKKCGSCTVKVNGTPMLACWEPALPQMTIEPIDNLPVIRDLVVSRDGYEAALASIRPELARARPYASFPEPITAAEFAAAVHLRDCIQCLSCQSVCPVLAEPRSGFAGPAALVALADLALDPRDGAERGRIAAEVANVFQCVSCYECERVCPVEIPIVTEAIEPLKRRAVAETDAADVRRARAFAEVVAETGQADAAAVAWRASGISLRTARVALRLAKRGKLDLGRTLGGLFRRPRRGAARANANRVGGKDETR